MIQAPSAPRHFISIIVEHVDGGWQASVRDNGETSQQRFGTKEEARTWAEVERMRLGTLVLALDRDPPKLAAKG
jgi:hypothetical protein